MFCTLMETREADVRAMVRIVGEVASISGGHAEKKHWLMAGLSDLISADAWGWCLSCQRDPDKPQIHVSILNRGFTEENLTKVIQATDHPQMIEIAHSFFSEVREKKTHLTRSQHQIIDDSIYQKTDAYKAWKEADIGSVILSLRPLDDQSGSMVCFYRRFNREFFTPREVQIAHIVLSEVPWLHLQGWPEDRGSTVPLISKRQRIALNLLTQGCSQKEIAAAMGVSIHTVREYIKDIYRHFKVDSQKQLMNRFMFGIKN